MISADLEKCAQGEWRPGRLGSLWDMLRVYADKYLDIGMRIHDAFRGLFFRDPDPAKGRPGEPFTQVEKERLKQDLVVMRNLCSDLSRPVSSELINSRLRNLPRTSSEFELLVGAIQSELKTRLFLYVPPHVADYYESDTLISNDAKTAFPSAYEELRNAGNALAADLNTACVFHSMRATEIGVRALGNALRVSFPTHPIDLAEWHNILDQADSKITAMKNLPKSTHKDEELRFYSEAAVQFRFFKDAWRVRVAHARAIFSESRAKEVLDHTRSFFGVIATRLSE
jgi:hypothetical protein